MTTKFLHHFLAFTGSGSVQILRRKTVIYCTAATGHDQPFTDDVRIASLIFCLLHTATSHDEQMFLHHFLSLATSSVVQTQRHKTMSYFATVTGHNHRDKTRVQMPAKIFHPLKVKCLLFMGPTLGFEIEQRNRFLIKFCVFYN
jgi:hypothetical protein